MRTLQGVGVSLQASDLVSLLQLFNEAPNAAARVRLRWHDMHYIFSQLATPAHPSVTPELKPALPAQPTASATPARAVESRGTAAGAEMGSSSGSEAASAPHTEPPLRKATHVGSEALQAAAASASGLGTSGSFVNIAPAEPSHAALIAPAARAIALAEGSASAQPMAVLRKLSDFAREIGYAQFAEELARADTDQDGRHPSALSTRTHATRSCSHALPRAVPDTLQRQCRCLFVIRCVGFRSALNSEAQSALNRLLEHRRADSRVAADAHARLG